MRRYRCTAVNAFMSPFIYAMAVRGVRNQCQKQREICRRREATMMREIDGDINVTSARKSIDCACLDIFAERELGQAQPMQLRRYR